MLQSLRHVYFYIYRYAIHFQVHRNSTTNWKSITIVIHVYNFPSVLLSYAPIQETVSARQRQMGFTRLIYFSSIIKWF